MELQRDEGLSKMLIPGVVLWRPLDFVGQHMATRYTPFEFEETGKPNQLVCKLRLEPDYIWEPTVRPVHTPAGLENSGIVVFVNGKVETSWTHLIVKGLSTALRANPRRIGGCVFTAAGQPCMDLADYCKFRRQLAQSIILNGDESLPSIVRTTEEHPGHTGNRRLVFKRFIAGDVEYEYEHIEDPR